MTIPKLKIGLTKKEKRLAKRGIIGPKLVNSAGDAVWGLQDGKKQIL